MGNGLLVNPNHYATIILLAQSLGVLGGCLSCKRQISCFSVYELGFTEVPVLNLLVCHATHKPIP